MSGTLFMPSSHFNWSSVYDRRLSLVISNIIFIFWGLHCWKTATGRALQYVIGHSGWPFITIIQITLGKSAIFLNFYKQNTQERETIWGPTGRGTLWKYPAVSTILNSFSKSKWKDFSVPEPEFLKRELIDREINIGKKKCGNRPEERKVTKK